MRIHAVINERAGSVLGQDHASIVAAVEEPFKAAGHDIVVDTVTPDRMAAALEAAAKDETECLLVGGGDGSVRTAADVAMAHGKILGIIPLGTLNRMARDLSIPLSLPAACEALASADVQNIDVASVNGRTYLCNSLLGLPPEYSAERQRLRGRPFGERIRGYANIIRTILSSRNRLRITIDDGGEQRPLRVISMAVSNNAYCEQPGLGLTRPKLDGGELALYASRHRSGWGVARALVRAIIGRWKGDPYLLQMRGHELTIRTGRPRIKLSNDGEVEVYTTPLVYKNHSKALKILRPAPSA
jgi:diacylglycerol kinase family enzyme